jgi:hypothetical protein
MVAEFPSPQALLIAARGLHGQGYRAVNAYSPFPVEGLAEALGFRRTRLPLITLLGALIGLGLALYLQFYSELVDYPINSGGRPYNSWPLFMPTALLVTLFGGALGAAFSLFVLNDLPQFYRPEFSWRNFERASSDAFFIYISATDRHYDRLATGRLLQELGATYVEEVSW